MQSSRVIPIPLFKGLQMVTDGVSLSETVYTLDVPRFKGLLSQAERLVLHFLTVGRTANFEWTVFVVPGFDRDHEANPFNLNGANFISSNGPGRVEYNTTANFLLDGRIEARCRNASGASGVNSASTSAVLAVKTWGS